MIVYQKARIFDPNSPTNEFYVQFNPNTLEYSAGLSRNAHKNVYKQGRSGKMTEQEHQNSPLAGNQSARLSVRLFFHSYTSDLVFSDVRPNINRIRAFLPAPPKEGVTESQDESKLPQITFAWGTLTHTGTLESFQVTYQMFAFDGTPVQAEAAITIRGEDPDVSAASNNSALNPASETDFSQQDDTLFLSGLSWLFQ